MRTDTIYRGFDDPVFLKDMAEVKELYRQAEEVIRSIQEEEDHLKGLTRALKAMEDFKKRIYKIGSYKEIMKDTIDPEMKKQVENLILELDEFPLQELICAYIEKVPEIRQLMESDPYLHSCRRYIDYLLLNISRKASPEEEDTFSRLLEDYNEIESAGYEVKSILIGDRLYTPFEVITENYPDPDDEKTDRYIQDYAERFLKNCRTRWKADKCFNQIYGFDSNLSVDAQENGMDEEILKDLLKDLKLLWEIYHFYNRCWGGAIKNPNDLGRMDCENYSAETGLTDPAVIIEHLKVIFKDIWPEFGPLADKVVREDWIGYADLKEDSGDCIDFEENREFRIRLKTNEHYREVLPTAAHEFAHAFADEKRRDGRGSTLNYSYSSLLEEVFSNWAEVYTARSGLKPYSIFMNYWQPVLEELNLPNHYLPENGFFDRLDCLLLEYAIMEKACGDEDITIEDLKELSLKWTGMPYTWMYGGKVPGNFNDFKYVMARLLGILIDSYIYENGDVIPEKIYDLWKDASLYTVREFIECLTGEPYTSEFWNKLMARYLMEPMVHFLNHWENEFSEDTNDSRQLTEQGQRG